MSKSKKYKKKEVFSFTKLSNKQYAVIIVLISGVVLLSLASFALNFQSKKTLISNTMQDALPKTNAIKLSPTVIPSLTKSASTYAQPIPTSSPTLAPTSVPTTAEIRFIYVNKDDGNPIQANGGRIEIKANDGSFDFGKDNVVEETVTGLKPTRHTLIMREPEGYTYYLFDLDNGNGTGFAAVNHCSVQLDPEPGRKLEARCLVKKN